MWIKISKISSFGVTGFSRENIQQYLGAEKTSGELKTFLLVLHSLFVLPLPNDNLEDLVFRGEINVLTMTKNETVDRPNVELPLKPSFSAALLEAIKRASEASIQSPREIWTALRGDLNELRETRRMWDSRLLGFDDLTIKLLGIAHRPEARRLEEENLAREAQLRRQKVEEERRNRELEKKRLKAEKQRFDEIAKQKARILHLAREFFGEERDLEASLLSWFHNYEIEPDGAPSASLWHLSDKLSNLSYQGLKSVLLASYFSYLSRDHDGVGSRKSPHFGEVIALACLDKTLDLREFVLEVTTSRKFKSDLASLREKFEADEINQATVTSEMLGKIRIFRLRKLEEQLLELTSDLPGGRLVDLPALREMVLFRLRSFLGSRVPKASYEAVLDSLVEKAWSEKQDFVFSCYLQKRFSSRELNDGKPKSTSAPSPRSKHSFGQVLNESLKKLGLSIKDFERIVPLSSTEFVFLMSACDDWENAKLSKRRIHDLVEEICYYVHPKNGKWSKESAADRIDGYRTIGKKKLDIDFFTQYVHAHSKFFRDDLMPLTLERIQIKLQKLGNSLNNEFSQIFGRASFVERGGDLLETTPEGRLYYFIKRHPRVYSVSFEELDRLVLLSDLEISKEDMWSRLEMQARTSDAYFEQQVFILKQSLRLIQAPESLEFKPTKGNSYPHVPSVQIDKNAQKTQGWRDQGYKGDYTGGSPLGR